jgi:hypothetical protein
MFGRNDEKDNADKVCRLCDKKLTYHRLPPDDSHIYLERDGDIEHEKNVSKPLIWYQPTHQDLPLQVLQTRPFHPISNPIASFSGIASSPQGCVSSHKSERNSDGSVELNAKTHTRTVRQSYTLDEEQTMAAPADFEFETAVEQTWTESAPLNHYQPLTTRNSSWFPGLNRSAIDPQLPFTGTKASLHESTPPSRTKPVTLPLNQWIDDSRKREDAFTCSDCQPTKRLRYDCGSTTTPAVKSTHSSHRY